MKAWMAGVAVFLLLAACGTMGATKWGDSAYVTMSDDFSGYESWTKVNHETITGDTTGNLGPAHEGAQGFREVYVNKTGKKVATSAAGYPYPEGTIIVKANSKEKMGAIAALTVMVKRGPTYDPANGNWEYIMTSPAFEVAAQGKVDMCIGCHTAGAAADYTFNDYYAKPTM